MALVKLFAESFVSKFSEELAISTVWIWRGMYFAGGLIVGALIFRRLAGA